MKLNLDEVMVQLSLNSDKKVPMALRKEIANAIYQTGRHGLADVALSTKMWNGDKDTDYSDDEVNSIKEFVEKSFVPAVIVAVQKVIEESKL